MDSKAPDKNQNAGPMKSNCWARWAYFAFGWLNVVLGVIGIVVPGMPTTVFLIAAAWAFSKSSERFHSWLWNHPRFGPAIRDWHQYKVIPGQVKIMASVMMTTSFLIVLLLAENLLLPLLLFLVMAPAAVYINTRASSKP